MKNKTQEILYSETTRSLEDIVGQLQSGKVSIQDATTTLTSISEHLNKSVYLRKDQPEIKIPIVDQELVKLISDEFSEIIREWFHDKPEELIAINKANKQHQKNNKPYCESHEYCDPNQAMIEACEHISVSCAPKYNDLEDNMFSNLSYVRAIEQAWTMSRENDFGLKNPYSDWDEDRISDELFTLREWIIEDWVGRNSDQYNDHYIKYQQLNELL